MKTLYIFLGMAFIAGVLVFWREVLALFIGMTVIEILKQIVTFALHVAWVTILVYAMTTLPEMVKPWMRFLKRKGYHKIRASRRTPVVMRTQKPESPSVRQLTAVLAKQAGVKSSPAIMPRTEEPEIRIGF
jgi:hypothetical protein